MYQFLYQNTVPRVNQDDGTRDRMPSYSPDHLCPHVCMLLFVTLGHNIILPRIHLHAVVPRPSRPPRTRSIHMTKQIWIIGNQKIRPNTSGRASSQCQCVFGKSPQITHHISQELSSGRRALPGRPIASIARNESMQPTADP